MEKSSVLSITVLLIGLAAFIWYDQSGMAESSSTPEKAVQAYMGDNPVEVIEVMELEDSVYVFHEQVASLQAEGWMTVTRVDKTQYGWKAINSLSFGPEMMDWASTTGMTVGSVQPETEKVIVRGVEAFLYTFKSTGKKIYLVHDQDVMFSLFFEEMDDGTVKIEEG